MKGSLPCPCGQVAGKKPQSYEACCGRYVEHFDSTPAPDAQNLMRSRYTAFVLRREGYLLQTWHASRRPSELTFDDDVKWIGLEVRSHRIVDPEHAEVEFVARMRIGGRASRLHERSRFVRENGRWYYVDGEFPDAL